MDQKAQASEGQDKRISERNLKSTFQTAHAYKITLSDLKDIG